MKDILISVLYWLVVTIFMITFRFIGINAINPNTFALSLGELYFNAILYGTLLGTAWGLVDLVDKKIIKRKYKSFKYFLFSRTIIYAFIFISILVFASWFTTGSLAFANQYVSSGFFIVNFFLFVIAGILFIFLKQMSKKFGPGVLFQYMTGKYFKPKEEDRIFLFIDLKSSTAIAEKLSHVLYSRLLQDCFLELTQPVLKFKAQIYQFVGDEAVITWQKDEGLLDNKCLNFYYLFTSRLENKKDYFLEKYGVFPEFKAGMSVGPVTVAEVGEIKTEIAYHGDVLNTASRIQGYCKLHDKNLLVSDDIHKYLSLSSGFKFDFVAKEELRGKSSKTSIYSVEKES